MGCGYDVDEAEDATKISSDAARVRDGDGDGDVELLYGAENPHDKSVVWMTEVSGMDEGGVEVTQNGSGAVDVDFPELSDLMSADL